MLVAEGGVEAAPRQRRRLEQVGERRAVIAARPEDVHRALDRGLRIELAGPAARHPRGGLLCHAAYMDRTVVKDKAARPAAPLDGKRCTGTP